MTKLRYQIPLRKMLKDYLATILLNWGWKLAADSPGKDALTRGLSFWVEEQAHALALAREELQAQRRKRKLG